MEEWGTGTRARSILRRVPWVPVPCSARVDPGGSARSRLGQGRTMHLDIWDYITFACFFVVGAGFLGFVFFMLGLPGRIACDRKHPDAEAIYMMGWLGFLGVVP